jgi:uncharacterized DUF497 family protein
MGTRHATLWAVKYFAWDEAKNARLRAERGIGFEDVIFHIDRGDQLDVLEHPNPERYGGQRIFIVRRFGYRPAVTRLYDTEVLTRRTAAG